MKIDNMPEFCENDHPHSPMADNISDSMPGEETMDGMAELFKVFGDTTRIKILYALSKGELCVCDVAEVLEMTQPAISYQLKVLKQAKLVKSRREGKMTVYSLDDSHVHTIIGMAKEHLEERG